MLKRSLLYAAVPAVALVALALLAAPGSAQTLSVHVVQVRASNEGNFVDPTLLGLGDRIKKQFPYRSYRRVGSDSQAGDVGGTLQFALAGDASLTIDLASFDDAKLTMHVAVNRGNDHVVDGNFKVKLGHTVLIGVPSGRDGKLILAITPTAAK